MRQSLIQYCVQDLCGFCRHLQVLHLCVILRCFLFGYDLHCAHFSLFTFLFLNSFLSFWLLQILSLVRIHLVLHICNTTLVRQVKLLHNHTLRIVRHRDRVLIQEGVSVRAEELVLVLELEIKVLLRQLQLFESRLHDMHMLLEFLLLFHGLLLKHQYLIPGLLQRLVALRLQFIDVRVLDGGKVRRTGLWVEAELFMEFYLWLVILMLLHGFEFSGIICFS